MVWDRYWVSTDMQSLCIGAGIGTGKVESVHPLAEILQPYCKNRRCRVIGFGSFAPGQDIESNVKAADESISVLYRTLPSYFLIMGNAMTARH